jgi:anion-transporting  ArsA/GET3 family ATPase
MSSLLDRRLILVAGKGGVGRSTVAAALGAACARRGRRTLLFEANANDRWGSFFHGDAVGTQVTRLRDNLHAVNTNPAAALEEYGLMVLRFKRVYKMVFENRVTRYFLRAIPGLDDYSILGKAWYHTTEERRGGPAWDTVIFDLPASGHSLTMLRLPKVILDTVPEGPLTRDARSLQDLLRDRERTAIVMVTLAEEMPVNEARELRDQLRGELGLELEHLVVNQVYPERFPERSPQARVLDALIDARPHAQLSLDAPSARPDGAGDDLAALATQAQLARVRRRLNEQYLSDLAGAFEIPQTRLPLLFERALGPAQIDELSNLLVERLAS